MVSNLRLFFNETAAVTTTHIHCCSSGKQTRQNCERRHVGDAQVLHAGCVREFASITEQLPKLLKLDRDDQIVVPVTPKNKNFGILRVTGFLSTLIDAAGSNTGPLDWVRQCVRPACFPAQSIRSNHAPSMRARPAHTAGALITSRASRVRPVQPTLHAHTVFARSKTAFLASNPRGSLAVRGWLRS